MKLGAKGIIVKNGKVLIIRRSNYDSYRSGEWDLPGGRIEEGEGVFEGHKREVMEETKLKIDIIEPLNTWLIERSKEKTAGITFINRYVEGEVELSNEHTEYKWIAPEEAKEIEGPEWMKTDIPMAAKLNPALFR